MNILFHFLFSVFLGVAIFDSNYEIVLFLIGGVLIDIDHLIVASWSQKSLSPKLLKTWLFKEYEKHNPHYYPLHTFEIIFLLLLVSFYFVNFPLMIIVSGMLVHVGIDILSYVYIYKSPTPWLKTMFLTTKLNPNHTKNFPKTKTQKR